MDREELLRQAMEKERENRIYQKRKRVFGSAHGLMDCTFDKDNGSTPQLEYARRYVEHWPEMRKENMGLLFWGPAGTGKTFAAACIANALVEREVGVRLITLGEALLNLYGMSGVFKRCLDLTVEFKTEQGAHSEPYLMLPEEYLRVSQCPNFILEEPFRIAEFIGAYAKNKAALFEKTDSMTIIGDNFKQRLKAVIGSVK